MTSSLGRPGAAGPAVRTGRRTRVTLSGARRRADLALPSDEPLGLLVPDLVGMVGGRPGAHPGGYQLTTVDGTLLDLAASLRDCGVPDGALVRLDPVTDSPPAPILHDVSDHVSDDADGLRGRWDATALRWTTTATVATGAVAAASLAGSAVGPAAPLAVAVVMAAAGAGTALSGRRPVGVAVLLAAVAAALVAVPLTTPWWSLRAMRWALVVAVAIALVGVVTGHPRAGFIGAGTLLLQLALWWGLPVVSLSGPEAAAVIAIVAIGLLGLLPRLAVMASGLASLDDRQASDEPVTRVAAALAVDAAHRGLAIACVATAVSGGLAGWVLTTAGSGWMAGLAGLLGVALLLRLRAFPLTVEVVALLAAGLAVGTGLLVAWMRADPGLWWAGAVAALTVTGVALVLLAHRPQPHVRARARQLADRFEGLVVVVAVPVAVGVFGVYEELLNTF